MWKWGGNSSKGQSQVRNWCRLHLSHKSREIKFLERDHKFHWANHIFWRRYLESQGRVTHLVGFDWSYTRRWVESGIPQLHSSIHMSLVQKCMEASKDCVGPAREIRIAWGYTWLLHSRVRFFLRIFYNSTCHVLFSMGFAPIFLFKWALGFIMYSWY